MQKSLVSVAIAIGLVGCHFNFDRALGPGEIRGTIVVATATGELIPADGTRVTLMNSAIGVQADSAGRFTLRGLPSGSYELRLQRLANGNDQVSSGLRLKVNLSGAVDLGRITLTALGRVQGTVTNAASPVARARVVLESGHHVTTDATGAFVFENVLPGDYPVFVQPVGGQLLQASATVRSKETTTLSLAVESLAAAPDGSLSGRVIAAGATDNATVSARLVSEDLSQESSTSGDGMFVIASLRAGIYELALSRDGYRRYVLETVVAGDTSLSDLVLVPTDCTAGTENCPDVATDDSDGDTVPDALDNCPASANLNQQDTDLDGIGDACRCGGVAALTCSDIDQCGMHSDGCGGMVDCGSCTPTGFTDDFTDPSHFDSRNSTALPNSSGVLSASAPRAFEGVGDGSEGAYEVSLTASDTLTAGVHQFTSFHLSSTGTTFKLNVEGDLTLLVTGSVTIDSNAFLNVTGTLTVIAGGLVSLDCGYMYSTGKLSLHLPSVDGLAVGCVSGSGAEMATLAPMTGADTEDVEVWTRGPIDVGNNGYIISGHGVNTGDVTLRAYGDITLGPADAYVFAADADSLSGMVRIYTEGNLLLDTDSYLINGDSGQFPRLVDGGMDVRVRGNITLKKDSYFIVENGAPLNVIAEGDILLEEYSYLLTGRADSNTPQLTVRAHNLTLRGSYVDAAGSTGKGGNVDIGLTGDLLVGQDTMQNPSSIEAGNGGCAGGGDLVVNVRGNIVLETDGYMAAGTGSGQNCTVTGNVLSVNAGGTITLGTDALVEDGTGAAGTLNEHSTIPPVLLDAALESSVSLISQPITLTANVKLASAAFTTLTPTAFFGAHLLISPAPQATFVPVEQLGATLLQSGWRYEVRLQPRMFDATSVKGLTVAYAAPP